MNDAPILDDFELDVARALRAKADQIEADDAPFSAEADPPRNVVRLTPARAPRRRVLAAVAAVVAAAWVGFAAVGVAQRLGSSGDPDVTMPSAGTRHTMRQAGTAGFVPATLPDGWTLREMDVGAITLDGHDARWQLFGAAGEPPLARGVLVGSTYDEWRVIEGATHTVHGQPTRVGPAFDPTAPSGALQASWLDGDVAHDAIAVGMDEAELLAFLDTLVAYDDPATGFRAPADTALPEVEAATVADSYTTSVTYTGPGGEADAVRVTATSSDLFAGMLHRLAGAPSPGGGLVMRGTLGGDPGYPFVSLATDDGWTVEVVSLGSPRFAQDPEVLDDIAGRLEPTTTQQLIDIGVAQPVTATHTVGDWTVEVHGTAAEDLAMCLTPGAGRTVCTTAEDDPAVSRLTAGSALVGGEWVVVAVTEGPEAATVETSSAGDTADERSPVELRGERERIGDTVVQVVSAPAEAHAVDVVVATGDDTATGFTYDRPAG